MLSVFVNMPAYECVSVCWRMSELMNASTARVDHTHTHTQTESTGGIGV